ncbi:uncharacterized protein LODBEIA_P24960 [Lodderomyces beijingensis]|uniref:DNA replication factor Cdt1 C-terminal domain-containing protein n=1 Tax=Lodderomyces beijingensis TaxID=1775926 RepID=A0ABP0ZLM3_9ASCO
MVSSSPPRTPTKSYSTLNRLVSKVKALDSVLYLHFASSVASPQLSKVLEQASTLSATPIVVEDIEQILAIAPIYQLVRTQDGVRVKFTSFAEDRVAIITSQFNKRSSLEATTPLSLRSASPRKITKPRSSSSSPTKRQSFASLKNTRSRFEYSEKDAQVESTKNSGLSLLERIKLKEKLANEGPPITPEMKYTEYLWGKVGQVYDVINQLYREQNFENFKSFSMTHVVKVVQDSIDHPINEREVNDVVRLITLKLHKFSLVERQSVLILKVSNLDREEDLRLLKTLQCSL